MNGRRLERRVADLETQIARLARGERTDEGEPIWVEQCLAWVDPDQQPAVRAVLHDIHDTGYGLFSWLSELADGDRLPVRVPRAVVDVYLQDPEAMPLHDCEDCGLLVPVRSERQYGMSVEPARFYFNVCPVCSGRVGWYAYWTKHGKNP